MKNKILKTILFIIFMYIPLLINATTYDAVITGDDVRIRTGAGTNNKVIVAVNSGTEIKVLDKTLYEGTGCTSKWLKISYNEKEGYICSKYVSYVDKTYDGINVIDWTARVSGNNVSVRKGAGSNYSVIEKLSLGANVTILSTSGNWYKIQYYGNKTGYISKDYVIKKSDITAEDNEYAKELKEKGFPDSYIPYLTYLHNKYPNWEFIASKTNLDFATAVNKESGKNYMQTTNDSYRTSNIPAEGSSWYRVNSGVIAFYMDPRNWLNEKRIFMFEKLNYDSNLEECYPALIKAIFGSGKLSDDIYTTPIFNAGKKYGISPIHIASRIRQEVSANGSDSTNGTTFTWKGKEYSGYYNFFNIGAYETTIDGVKYNAIVRGLAYAAKLIDRDGEVWNNIDTSINEGVSFLAVGYITKGQNTLYYQKFNVGPNAKYSKYTHQYQTNIQAPATEGNSTYNSHISGKTISQNFTFEIPIYNNMPSYTSLPNSGDNNNNLSKLEVVNYNLTPSFDEDILNYETYVPKTTNNITINATPQSSTATVSGNGEIELKEDETDITVTVTSETGIKKQYTITIIKVEDTTSNNDVISSSYVNTKDSYLTNIKNDTNISDLKNNLIKNGAKEIIIYDKNNKVLNSGILATGQKLTIVTSMDTKTYTVVVKGDTSGDGKVTILDLLQIQKHLLKDKTLSNEYFLAADTSGDNKVTILDLLQVQKHLVGDKKL